MKEKRSAVLGLLQAVMAVLAAGVLGLTLYGVLRPEAPAAEFETDRSAEEEKTTPADQGTPDETEAPALEPSPEQYAILDGLIAAFQTGDDQAVGAQLKAWNDLHGQEEENWVDVTGMAYDGQNLAADSTGTALASDGLTRFYYGPLTGGVPDGAGARIVIYSPYGTYNHDETVITYFWVEGLWDDGILTGDAEIRMDQAPRSSPDVMREHMEISCTFDGTAAEIMSAGQVMQYVAIAEWSDDHEMPVIQRVYPFAYHISNGKLLAEEWSDEATYDGSHLHDSAQAVDGWIGQVGVPALGSECFQNPYPWGGSYRFAYRNLFDGLPTLYGERSA